MGGSDDAGLIALSGALMTAAADARKWPDAMRIAADVLGGVDVSLETFGVERRDEHRIFMGDRHEAMQTGAAHHWLIRNPRIALLDRHPIGSVMFDRQLGDEGEIARLPYYAEFLNGMEMYYYAASLLVSTPHAQVAVALHRARGQGHVEAADIARFAAVAPLFGRAVYVAQTLGDRALRTLADWHDAGGDGRRGILIIGRSGRILHLNRAAEAMAGEQDGLAMRDGRVVAPLADDNGRLQRLVADVVALTRPEGGGLDIARPSGRQSYAVLVMPLNDGDFPFLPDPPAAMMIVTDPARHDPAAAARLQSMFDFTAREAELAVLLCRGLALVDAAARMGINPATARSHLKTIFAKADVRRQPELVLRLTPFLG